jgi:hypothetical protein
MVLPVSDIEMFVPLSPPPDSSSKNILYLLFWFLVVLSFAHLGYGDFWGFLLDLLFALLGYITFKRMQLSTIAFFSFLCAFNAGIDLMASISLLSSISSSSATDLDTMASSLHMHLWQLVMAASVITLDAIVYATCLVLTCKVYSELRANVYSQLGLLGQPFLIQRQPEQNQAAETAASGQQGAFRAFQGRPHRIEEGQQTTNS